MNNMETCQTACKEQSSFAKDDILGASTMVKSAMRVLTDVEVFQVAGGPETQNDGGPG